MSNRKVLIKVGVVATSILFGAVLVGSKISFIPANKTGISNALGQRDFKRINTVEDTYKSRFDSIKDLMNAGMALVEEIEAEGAVLLKNDNTLPLAKNTKVNLVGFDAVYPAYGGRGSAQGGAKTEKEISLYDGVKDATAADGSKAGFDINNDAFNLYKNSKNNDFTADIESSVSKFGGVAVFNIERTGGEGSDKTNGANDTVDYLALTKAEQDTLKGLKKLKTSGKIDKIIVLMNYSNQIADFLDDPAYGIDAALWIGNPGQTGFAAVGDILAGGVNPSGHLSDMHWYNHNDNPVSKNFGAYVYKKVEEYVLPKQSDGSIHPKYSTYDVYQEGMYVGYRYAETRYSDVVTGRENTGEFDYSKVVAHPFGYGGSYTDFEYSNYSVQKNGTKYTVSVDVKNVGNVAGKDAVQIYLQKPYNNRAIENKIEVPAVELVGFAKTSLLEAGKSETVKIDVDQNQFTVYDANGAKTYIINDGRYYLTAAKDAHDAMNNILASQGFNENPKMTAKGNDKLASYVDLEYDAETYSKSRGTGKAVTNLFDESDITKFSGRGIFNKGVKYVSRNNWMGTLPTTNVSLNMSDGIAAALVAQDDKSRIQPDSKAYPNYGVDNGLKLITTIKDSEGKFVEYDDKVWDKLLDQLTWEETIQLISDGLRKTPALSSIAKPGTVDHNGPAGLVEAYGTNPDGLAYRTNDKNKDKRAPYYPCAGIISATFNPELATKFGDMLGEDALWAGYAGFYGVAINTHRSPYEGRAFEYFSEDPFLAGKIAANESKALQSHGCNAYIKHFALNEQENSRQGVQIWLNEQTLREIYLRPFEMAVVDGGAMNAMASFTRIGTEFNPACKALQTDWLRGEVGMKGLVVTDMYDIGYEPDHMPTFVLAGTDLPDGSVVDVFNAYKTKHGELAWAMRESAHRVLYSTAVSNAMNGIGPNTKIVKATPQWIVALTAADITLGVLWAAALGGAIYFGIADYRKRKQQ